ncbi:putative GTP diphosphokinase RSH2, chloroplastic [Sesbania bispinosa]|nr:putative GTP diphosphokinase RSH2, chloroplastic [Sesbania bispinosa]
MGGLLCLFSSPAVAVKHAPLSSSFSGVVEEDELKELSSSFSYSPSKFGGSSWRRDQSPVSVFHGPVSCSSSTSVRSSRSSTTPVRIRCERGTGTSGFFDGFVRSALGFLRF